MSRKRIKTGIRKVRPRIDLLGRALELPPGTLEKGPHIELSTNREAVVDGCRGVIDYNEDRIKLNLGRGTVTFKGRNLQISSFNQSLAVIRGFILSLEFNM
ncbi:MAG TPA: sporulation protein [Clostridiales bacterium]|nr:sporulation protein [Clostridiales bacterium]